MDKLRSKYAYSTLPLDLFLFKEDVFNYFNMKIA